METVIAAVEGDNGALVAESADLIYHLLVLLKSRGVASPTSRRRWRSGPACRASKRRQRASASDDEK